MSLVASALHFLVRRNSSQETRPTTTSGSSASCKYLPNCTSRLTTNPCLNQDSLYFIQAELIIPAVIQPGGASALVVSHLLRDLQLAPIAVTLHLNRDRKKVGARCRHAALAKV